MFDKSFLFMTEINFCLGELIIFFVENFWQAVWVMNKKIKIENKLDRTAWIFPDTSGQDIQKCLRNLFLYWEQVPTS